MKVGVIGIGYWGGKHVEEYNQLGHNVTICDNDEENIWISGNTNFKTKFSNHSLIYALFVALFLTTIPPLIYFSRINLKDF